MTPPTQLHEQISLPGQTHVAEGPYDQTPMYLMHHAFRRDLRRFEAAVRATPLGEVAVWNALARRWDRFAEVPQLEIAALTITRSPSMIGDVVRPPCVVKAANSSPIERSHSSLPFWSRAMTVAPTPIA